MYNTLYQDSNAVPLGEDQPARVIDSNYPTGGGRVRVQFSWQESKGEKTPWLRLIQPHSGSGKGFHFIPEIGEEVMVGFESQNAEKPFKKNNNIKSSEDAKSNELNLSNYTLLNQKSFSKEAII